MSFLEIIMISVGLAMDAFAVSVGKGLSVTNLKFIHGVIVGGYFGGFQALMPFLGYLFGSRVEGNVVDYIGGMITFLILSVIGLKMIKDADELQDVEK
ncbi:MAG: manganese efflux pump, partial [Erysipelotrichia bacterium]|nr:manganese efflux pump [Erysipelotrichia bacterium]